MNKLNDFEKICKYLNGTRKNDIATFPFESNYDRAYDAVEKYVMNDEKKLLSLKAEAQQSNFFDYFSMIVGGVTVITSVLTILFTVMASVFSENKVLLQQLGIAVLVVVTIAAFGLFVFMHKFSYINVWRGHIQVSIEELDKKMKQNSKKK